MEREKERERDESEISCLHGGALEALHGNERGGSGGRHRIWRGF